MIFIEKIVVVLSLLNVFVIKKRNGFVNDYNHV